MPLDTLSNVKLGLAVTGIGDDALLAQLQASADSFIETACGRNFGGGTFTEDHPGGGHLLFLKNFPVAAVGSIKVDATRVFPADSLVPAVDYIVHADRGVIELLDGNFIPTLPGWNVGRDAFPGAVRVVYTLATGAVPAAVLQAYTDLVGHWYRQAKTHAATGQLNLVESGGTVYPWGQSSGFKIPGGILALLRPFRSPVV